MAATDNGATQAILSTSHHYLFIASGADTHTDRLTSQTKAILRNRAHTGLGSLRPGLKNKLNGDAWL